MLQQQHQLELDDPWRPPGVDAAADVLRSNGSLKTAEMIRKRPIAVFAIGASIAMVVLLVVVGACYWWCCRRRPQALAVDGAGAAGEVGDSGSADAAAAVDESEEGREMAGQISKLKREKTRILFEQAMRKAKLEKLVNEIMQLEAERENRRTPPLSQEEASRQVEDAMRATEMFTERSLISVLAYVAPLAYQSRRVMELMERRRVAVQARAAKVALDEAKVFCRDLGEVFSVNEDVRQGMFGFMSNMELPSIATIVQSALAPAKLNFSCVILQLGVAVSLACVLIDLFVVVMDRQTQCIKAHNSDATDGTVYRWFSVDLSVSCVCCLIRAWLLFRTTRAVNRIEEPPEAPDSPVVAFRMLLDYYMTVGADAWEAYESIQGSWLNMIANLIFLFSIGWMMRAVWVVFNTPWAFCMAAGVIILRIRVCLFLVFLIPILLEVVNFFVTRYVNSDGFKVSLIAAADNIDALLGIGVPVFGKGTQAMLARSPRDLTSLSLRRAESKKYQLGLQQNEAEQKLREVEASKLEVDSQIQRLQQKRAAEDNMTDDELRARHIQAKDAIVKDAESFFAVLSGKAEEMSMQAERTVKKWDEEGAIDPRDLLDAGVSREQVQEYLQAAKQQAKDQIGRVVGKETLQRTLEQVSETAQSTADAVRERAKELPSLDEVKEKSKEALDKAKEMGSAAMDAVAAKALPEEKGPTTD